jgi:hypothetical protein
MKQQGLHILNHLKSGKTLTPLEALQMFGCLRLAARVHDLRNEGWPVLKEMRTHPDNEKVHYAEYYLAKDEQTWPDAKV